MRGHPEGPHPLSSGPALAWLTIDPDRKKCRVRLLRLASGQELRLFRPLSGLQRSEKRGPCVPPPPAPPLPPHPTAPSPSVAPYCPQDTGLALAFQAHPRPLSPLGPFQAHSLAALDPCTRSLDAFPAWGLCTCCLLPDSPSPLPSPSCLLTALQPQGPALAQPEVQPWCPILSAEVGSPVWGGSQTHRTGLLFPAVVLAQRQPWSA